MSKQILEIYEQFQIPSNLQRHMLEVAAVGEYICQHWQGELIKTELIIETLLLHDLGNIVKFKRPFLGELEREAAHWARVQDEFIKNYGSRATQATIKIVEEIGARHEVAEIILDMSPLKGGELPFKRLETRICSFADMCVTPRGIEGFEARMIDLRERYPTARVKEAINHERANAKIIQEHTTRDVFSLPREELEALAIYLMEAEVMTL